MYQICMNLCGSIIKGKVFADLDQANASVAEMQHACDLNDVDATIYLTEV